MPKNVILLRAVHMPRLAACLGVLLLYVCSAAAQVAPSPELSHSARTYVTPFVLTIDVPEGAIVRYTTNGAEPTEASPAYQAGQPIHINGTMTVRARAFRDGYAPSETVSGTFVQLGWDVEDFNSNLPLVIVNQFGNVMHPQGHHRSTVRFSVIDRDSDGRARLLNDRLHLQSWSDSNYRGTSSLSFPKKQFGVRLIDDDGRNRNERVLGMPSENNWIMSAPWDDRSLIRNAVAYQVSRDMGRYAPRTRFVELFLHSGSGPLTGAHYHGVYMLVERIKWDDNRVDIARLRPDHDSEPEITGGYILNFESGREWHIESSNRRTRFALVRPQVEDITVRQANWIEDYLGDLETELFGPNFRNPQTGYAAYLDPESFIDHHLITETFKEMDGYRLSTYLHKDRGGRMVMGPVWDYNLSLGNYSTTGAWNGHDPTGWYYTYVPEESYLNGWYNRLFRDPDFQDQYRARWWELRRAAFSTDHIVNMMHRFVEEVGEATDRNFERWPILGLDVWEYSRVGFPTYDEEISYMVDWIETRLAWIDTQMGKRPDDLHSGLRYFWYFGTDLPNDKPLSTIPATLALSHPAGIRFESALDGYPFDSSHPSWRKASMERRNSPTELNYRSDGNAGRPFDADAMRGIQVRQPFRGDGGENTVIFDVPTTGLQNVVFRFAAMDEGAADALFIDYSTARDGVEWTTAGLGASRLELSKTYQMFEVDLRDIDTAEDNPDLKIRVRFDGRDMSADRGNRVTFNNISLDVVQVPTSTSPDDAEHPSAESISGMRNHPNPFDSSTNITFSLSRQGDITITVYDAVGRRVASVVEGYFGPGEHTVTFDASDLPSGLYLYRLQTGDLYQSGRMILAK